MKTDKTIKMKRFCRPGNKNVSKKAQITLFIIIGLIIIILAGIFLTIRNLSEEKEVEINLVKIDSNKDLKNAINSYVDSCLKPITLHGLEILRLQGGYIDIPEETSYKVIQDPNYESVVDRDGIKRVEIEQYSPGNKVPFWVTKDAIAIPALKRIEFDLEVYIENEMESCLEDFQPFRDLNYDINRNEVISNVTFGTSVVVDIFMPSEFIKDKTNIYLENFIFTVPINMPKVYEIALTLAVSESELAYLEFTSNNLWGLYGRVDEEALPPFRAERVNADGSYITWDLNSVKTNYQNIIAKNMYEVKPIGTDYEDQEGIYKSFKFNILPNTYENVEVNYVYRPNWNMYNFEVTPNPLMPSIFEEMDIPMIAAFYVFKYRFKYDAEYAILTEVNDKSSAKIYPHINQFEEAEGYKFQFLNYVAIYGNQPREYVSNPNLDASGNLDYASLGINESGLADLGLQVLPESYFCDEEQKLTRNMTVEIKDIESNEGIERVTIFYECGSYQNDCLIGRTNENGILKTKMPLCQNGIIKLNQGNYESKEYLLTTTNDQESTISYALQSYKRLNASVKKYKMPRPNTIGSLMSLENGERIVLTVKKVGSDSFGTRSNQVLTFGTSLEENEIILLPGQYEISGTMLGVEMSISSQCKRICTSEDTLGNCNNYQYLPEEEISFGSGSLAGGVEFSQYTNYWTITEEDLRNSNNIMFYIIQTPIPTCIDNASSDGEECMLIECIGLGEMGKSTEYSSQFINEIQPRFN